MAVVDIVAVLVRIIYLSHKGDARIISLHLRNGPLPEFTWHHFRHVAAEAVNSLSCPEAENLQHLAPGVGNRVEMVHMATHIIHAIVQFHRLIPVVRVGIATELVVACGFGRHLHVGIAVCVGKAEMRCESLSAHIIEVVGRREIHVGVVVGSKIRHSFRLGIRMILACHMIRHKVDDHLQPRFVCPRHQVLKFLHPAIHVSGKVRIYVVVVFDGVWTAGLSFNHSRMILTDAISSIVSLRCVFNYPRIPNVRGT